MKLRISTCTVLICICCPAIAQPGPGPADPVRFADCGILGPGPQGCTMLNTDEGASYAVENTGGFGFGTRVWVDGELVQQSTLCTPPVVPAIINNTIGRCFEDCGLLQVGPQGCPILRNDDNTFLFIENTGGFNIGDRVWVQGCLNPQSFLCGPFVAPGIEDNHIGRCFEGCGTLFQGIECVLFQSDDGGIYQLEYLAAFGPGDRVDVTGRVNPDCVGFCFPPNGCIEDNTIQACVDCVPTSDGQFCTPQPCSPIPEANCEPICARLDMSTGQITVLECGCRTPNQCHVNVFVDFSPYCVGDCPPGMTCHDSRVFLPDGSMIICCRCRACDCPGDMNFDGVLNGDDIQAFVRCLLMQPTPANTCACADVNGDGAVNEQDIPLFVLRLLHKASCPSEGACCVDVDDGPLQYDGCFVTSPQNCEQNGGHYQGDDTTCNVQACCLPNNFCQDADERCCIASGGFPLGEGTTCGTADQCPPIGACCLDIDDGPLQYDTCIVTTQANCHEQGGVFDGPGSTCNIVACCLPTGACQDTDERCCLASGGFPLGNGSTCNSPIPCPPVGACCLDVDDGPLQYDTCFVTSQGQCQNQGGIFQGAGTECQTRACCLPTGHCQDADPRCCQASGGRPQNVPCSAIAQCPPIGACCFSVTGSGIPESCAVLTSLECQAVQGAFQGPGTQCQGTGACCFGITGGGCVVVDQICCDDILGTFKGVGTTCLGDANNNGLDDVCEQPDDTP